MWAMLLMAGLSGYAIQPPGAFHGDEPVARDGEIWLALQVQGDRTELVSTRLQVRTVRDELLDAPDQTTGREVSSAFGQDAMLFLRGENLMPGPVQAARVTPTGPDQPVPLRYTIHFGNHDYRIRPDCTPAPAQDGQAQFHCKLLLEGGGKIQSLVAMTGYSPPGDDAILLGDDGRVKLLFAGDLDRDGQLDLIFDTSDHYNVMQPTLFLSTQAQPGELVHEVARHRAVGC